MLATGNGATVAATGLRARRPDSTASLSAIDKTLRTSLIDVAPRRDAASLRTKPHVEEIRLEQHPGTNAHGGRLGLVFGVERPELTRTTLPRHRVDTGLANHPTIALPLHRRIAS